MMPIDQPPAIVEQVKPGKTFSVSYSYGDHAGRGRGWWARITGNAYPFGAWRMDRGPYPFKWMAQLEFPIERLTPDGPRR
jgi:hypothetical protein